MEYEDKLETIRIKKAEIQHALKVDGYNAFLPFEDDVFLMDNWHFEDALNYLVGIKEIFEVTDGSSCSKHFITLGRDFYQEHEAPHITTKFELLILRLRKLWESGLHDNYKKLSFYIDWALSKKTEIPWLNYAIEKGFYKSKQLHETDKPIAEKERAHLSNDLAILNQAATKFWANADPSDDTTHPINSIVSTWLIQRGFSATLADKGATIIRPEWATTGRKTDK